MKKNIQYIFIFISIIFSPDAFAQLVFDWATLPNAPFGTRINDAFFVNPDTGWIVNGEGNIWRTTNGGNSFDIQFQKNTAHFRSVGFLNPQIGFAGNVGPGEFSATDTSILYKTTNAGVNWFPFNNFTGPKPAGLCGMYVFNDSTVFSVGRVRGPAFFVKTTDGGSSWISKDMGDYAAGLIDCIFFTPDSGFAVGLSNSTHSQSRGIILSTSDGGESWDTSFITSRTGEWCWKMSFPSRSTGYISLQRNVSGPAINIIKTTNGGVTWFEKEAFDFYYFAQGIGFLNDTLGWIGGNSSFPVYQTTDGGETWEETDFGTRVNRFRFLSDTVGYAVGQTVYKFTAQLVTSVSETVNIPDDFYLYQNYPNPFNPSTKIKYTIGNSSSKEIGLVTLKIFDILGNEITTLVNDKKLAGEYEVDFSATDLPTGIYFYRLTVTNKIGSHSDIKKMILLK
jgi:photosystem II stability/assembly factor-like uncharacterized protein